MLNLMSTEKSIKFTNKIHPLLEDFDNLSAPIPEQYVGFIYIWYCIPEETYYIGKHVGKITDEYDGSGRKFKQVFRHYGVTQFKRAILEYVSDLKNVKYIEQKWISTFNAVHSKSFYNMKNSTR